MDEFAALEAFLLSVPGVRGPIGEGRDEGGRWWVRFALEIDHPLAWNVVQELGHVLNYLSLDERLPTVFKPVSPPPSMNGGPRDHLSWVIENTSPEFSPGRSAEWLEGRLPRPVGDLSAWAQDDA